MDEPRFRVENGGGSWFSRCWAGTSELCCQAIRDPRVIIGLCALVLFVVAFGFGFLAGFLSRRPEAQPTPQTPPPPVEKVTFLMLDHSSN